jgi:transglutaminase-like putative cysteine protease
MLIEIEHAIRFEYDAFIHESFMELRVEPLTDPRQTLRSFYLAVGPPTRVARYADWNGNFVHHFGVTDYHDRIEVLVRSAVATQPADVDLAQLTTPPPDPGGGGLGPLLDFALLGGPVERTGALEQLEAALAVDTGAPLGEQIAGIGRELFQRFEYRQGVTDYRSSTRHILEHGGGVCQDFAHLMLGVLRLRRIPCRYVSGYLHLEQGGEPSQSHAWVETWVPGNGWIGFDPTHDCVPDERYVVVARGRHYDDVPPNRGIFRGGARELLQASVATRTAPPKDVASLQLEIGQLDVPVFRDEPRGVMSDGAPVPDPQQQQ